MEIPSIIRYHRMESESSVYNTKYNKAQFNIKTRNHVKQGSGETSRSMEI
jgi:hypothetical protein